VVDCTYRVWDSISLGDLLSLVDLTDSPNSFFYHTENAPIMFFL